MVRLAFNYARIIVETGECVGCKTYSYEINDDRYIRVPQALTAYVGKYYNRADGLWYTTGDFSVLADGLN